MQHHQSSPHQLMQPFCTNKCLFTAQFPSLTPHLSAPWSTPMLSCRAWPFQVPMLPIVPCITSLCHLIAPDPPIVEFKCDLRSHCCRSRHQEGTLGQAQEEMAETLAATSTRCMRRWRAFRGRQPHQPPVPGRLKVWVHGIQHHPGQQLLPAALGGHAAARVRRAARRACVRALCRWPAALV
jgi:hypothetical protein